MLIASAQGQCAVADDQWQQLAVVE